MRTALEPGARLAHYLIAGRLGAGGMGEVYKAQDTVLGRSIALKVLPLHLVRNDERMRRFVQEARSASSLNHPHIVTIYEIGQAAVTPPGMDGPGDEPPIHYIAMELVEGVTLRTKIHDEKAGLRTLLSYIAQAAEGLAKAHAAGIVHRDLKPDNIMVTGDGFAKVLDFGLAKLTPRVDGTDATRTLGTTEETADGLLLGTVAYMSPEQVQGRAADHRSDVFAMGAILYEAATGRRPFAADSDVEVMHKILHDKPEAVADLSPSAPAELRRTIRRCLAKEPERRFQSMKDLAIELAEIVEEYDQLSVASSSGSRLTSDAAAVPPVAASRMSRGVLALLGILLLAAVLFAGYQWQTARDAGASPVAFESMNIRPLTSSGTVTGIAISPDGRYVAYATRSGGRSTGWIHQVATGSDVRVIPDQSPAITSLTFSPDGNYLYYTSAEEGRGNVFYSWLYVVPSLGGQARKVAFDVDTELTFSPDGSRIAFGRGVPAERQNHVVVMRADGTGETKLAGFHRYIDAPKPAWSPDGSKIVTSTIEMNPAWTAVLMEIDVESGATRRIGDSRRFGISDVHFLADGSALLMTATDAESAREQIWLQPYPDGAPVRVTNDLSGYRGLWPTGDGALLAAIRRDDELSFALADVGDTMHGPVVLSGLDQVESNDVSASASGTLVYSNLTRSTSAVASDVMVTDTTGAVPRSVTRGGENFGPVISRDGRTIVFSAESTSAAPRLYAVDVDGSNLRPVTEGRGEMDPSVSADGRMLAYLAGQGAEVWVRPLEGGEARKITDRNNGSEPGISPDGQLVFFTEWVGDDQDALHLKVVPISGGSPVLDMPIDNALDLRWHPRGDTITFRRMDGGVTNLFGITVATGEPRQMTRFERGTFAGYAWVDDDTVILAQSRNRSDAVLISDWRRPRS